MTEVITVECGVMSPAFLAIIYSDDIVILLENSTLGGYVKGFWCKFIHVSRRSDYHCTSSDGFKNIVRCI